MAVPIIVCLIMFGIGFWIGHYAGWSGAKVQHLAALEDQRKIARTRLEEIQSLEKVIDVREDQLDDAAKNYDLLEKKLKSAEEFRDGVLELAKRGIIHRENVPMTDGTDQNT